MLCEKKGCYWSKYGQLIEDAKFILNSSRSWSVGHKREANEDTHNSEGGYSLVFGTSVNKGFSCIHL
jgi:hypothetical protein